MAEERFDLVLELLTDLQAGQRDFRQEMHAFRDDMYIFRNEMYTFRDEMHAFRDEMHAFRDQTNARMDALEALARQLARRVDGVTIDLAALKREAASLRQAITDYHGSVLGHGVLLTELEERLARVERHLDLRS